MITVVDPDAIIVKRTGRPAGVLDSIYEVIVDGGEYVAGNGYRRGQDPKKKFSFGYKAPASVELRRTDGKMARVDDCEMVLFRGGTPVEKAEMDRLEGLTAIPPRAAQVPHATEIADNSRVDVVDNAATIEIADPVQRGTFRDDFWDLAKRYNEAKVGPQGEILDEFDQLWQLQRSHHGALEEQAPFARQQPPSALRGLLGGNASCRPGETPVRVAMWDGDDAETTPVTITFGPTSATALPVAVVVGPGSILGIGQITWGTRGLSYTAEVDCTTGAQLTIGASYVSASVYADQRTASTGLGADQRLIMSGTISFMPCVRTGPLTRTRMTFVDSGQTSAVIAIPAFAKRLLVRRTDSSAALTIRIYDPNAVLYTFTIAAAAEMADPVPLPGGATRYDIANTNATASTVSAVFELGL